MTDKTKIGDLSAFADNAEPRLAVVILGDDSGSMKQMRVGGGVPVTELNEGLLTFGEQVVKNPVTAARLEIAVVAFGHDVRVMDCRKDKSVPFDSDTMAFVSPDNFTAPTFTAQGTETHISAGALRALQLLRYRKDTYKAGGVEYYRPFIVLISDGSPQGETQDEVAAAQDAVKLEEARKGVICWSVAVEGADASVLKRFNTKGTLFRLKGTNFADLFDFVSKSASAVMSAEPGDQVPLAPGLTLETGVS